MHFCVRLQLTIVIIFHLAKKIVFCVYVVPPYKLVYRVVEEDQKGFYHRFEKKNIVRTQQRHMLNDD